MEDAGWQIESIFGDAATLHGYRPIDSTKRYLVFMHPSSKTLVLGSGQRSAANSLLVENQVPNSQVVFRDSGGGAVLVSPNQQLWLGIFIPVSDSLFRVEISESFQWIGEFVARFVSSLGVSKVSIVDTPSPKSKLSNEVCFGGASYGEVLVDGRKISGISQRRMREVTVFHLMIQIQEQQRQLASFFGYPPEISEILNGSVVSLEELIGRSADTLDNYESKIVDFVLEQNGSSQVPSHMF